MQAIYRRELGYQRGNSFQQPRLFRWIAIAGLATGIAAAVWIIALELGIGAAIMRNPPVPQPALRQTTFMIFFALPVGILAPIGLIFYAYTLIMTLTHAAGAVTREKASGTWEPLILTRLNTWQILFGKAWATFTHLVPSYFVLALMRFSLILAWTLTMSRARDTLDISRYWFLSAKIAPDELLMVGGSVLIFTLLDLSLTTAFGLLGGLINRKNAVPLALVLRLTATTLLGLLLILIGSGYLDLFAPVSDIVTLRNANTGTVSLFQPDGPQSGTPEYTIGDTLRDTGRTLLDGGLSLHSRWIRQSGWSFVDLNGNELPLFTGYAVPVSLLAFALFIYASLFTAQRVGMWQGGA